MAITNFGTLKTAVATRLSRSNMTALIPDFITIAQAKMMNGDPGTDPRGHRADLPPLRVTDMLASETLVLTGGLATLPADYLEATRLYADSADQNGLSYLPPQRWYTLQLTREAGQPRFYTIEGRTLKVAPVADQDVNLLYYAALDVLEDDADTNFIFTQAPMAYLYGALAEAHDHIRQHDRAIFYHNQFASAVRAMNNRALAGEISGDVLTMRPDAIT